MNNEITYIFGTSYDDVAQTVRNRLQKIYSTISAATQNDPPNLVFSTYYLYPYLFHESFSIDGDILIDLCILSVLCLDSCLYDDKILDGQEEIKEMKHHAHNLINIEIGRLMEKITGNKNNFMDYYHKYYEEYTTSTRWEREKHFGQVNEYAWDEYLMISRGKQAMCKIIPAIFCCLQNDYKLLEDYEKAMDLYASGIQLYDDLRDWKDDFNSQRLSWLLNQILTKSDLNLISEITEISDFMFNNRYDILNLDIAKRLLDESMVISKNKLSPNWHRYTRSTQNYVNKLMMDMLKIRKCEPVSYEYLYRNTKTEHLQIKQDVLEETFTYIEAQYQKDVMDVKEWMVSQDPDDPKKIQVLGGDVFMRAQMLNLMIEACPKIQKNINHILEHEISYLLYNRSKTYRNGWVYVEGLYGNCPDLDTFSEILRISDSSGHEGLKTIVSEILNKTLAINQGKPNFSTWIIDEDEPVYDFLLDNFTMMGDLEVTSNMMKSLYQIAPAKYETIITKSLNWIKEQQTEEGYWMSTWYIGNYYCGYVLAPLSKINNFMDTYEKFIKYIYQTQNENGSWGDGEGNPLDTAYALYSIAEVTGIQTNVQKNYVNKGISYLLSTRNKNGHWYSCEYIKMGKGKTDTSRQHLRYKSVTLTTVYCFTALVKVYHALGGNESNENK